MTGPSAVKLRLAPAPAAAARFAVERWHYSREFPVGKNVSYGVWEDEDFIGVLVFGKGANRHIGSPFGLSSVEVCELVRVALRTHASPVTRIVSIALKLLARDNPKLKAVISYADPQQGHAGIIYKAGNWLPWGKSTPFPRFYNPDGSASHHRTVTKDGMKRDEQKARYRVEESLPKHRFVYFLDKNLKKEWTQRNETTRP